MVPHSSYSPAVGAQVFTGKVEYGFEWLVPLASIAEVVPLERPVKGRNHLGAPAAPRSFTVTRGRDRERERVCVCVCGVDTYPQRHWHSHRHAHDEEACRC
jgi:hypothetical protein